MSHDNLFVGEHARAQLMAGVDKIADAVKGTLGAGGYNALIADPRPPFSVATNDGISVARAIQLTDPVEQMGANLMREIGSKSDKDGGDGTTTAITLAQAILQEGLKSDASPMDIKRSLDECLPLILKSIDDQTKGITVDEVGSVASISSEDDHIGALIQEVYQKIGKDGILYPDVILGGDDHYTIGNGVKIEEAGLVSPYMSDTGDDGQFTKTVKITSPRILVTKQKISRALEFEPIVNTIIQTGTRDLVVFCDEMDAGVIPDLIQTRAKGGFRVMLIKLPTLWKDEWFEDVSRMTGATIIDPSLGLAIKDAPVSYLGTCDQLVVDRYDTYLDGIKDITDTIATLDGGTEDDKIRAARLNTKTARLYVGADSDSALSYKRLKLEDARNASWQALHGGVVAGGGIALLNASKAMPDTIGGTILKRALVAPVRQICENAGHLDISDKFLGFGDDFHGKNVTHGLNAKTGEMVDMFEARIIDPATVTKNAVSNALSVAGIVLTTRVVIPPPDMGDNDIAQRPRPPTM